MYNKTDVFQKKKLGKGKLIITLEIVWSYEWEIN